MSNALLLALLATAAAPPAQPPSSLTPQSLSGALQTMVGQTYEGGVRLAGVRAEGDTLVLVLDGPRGWRRALSPLQTSDVFLDSFCQDRDFEYFVHGNLMRVDTIEGGADSRPGPVINACPPTHPARP